MSGSVQFVCADPNALPREPVYPLQAMPDSLLPQGYSPTNSLLVQLFPPQFRNFVTGRETLILFGFVQYGDIIGQGADSIHESRFRMECRFPGYISMPNGEIAPEPLYFTVAGPEAYNRYS